MKKIDQSPESFRLDSAAGQNSRIDQRSALWTDLALLWGYLVGTGGWLFSLLGISVYAPVLLGGAAVFSAAAVFLLHASGKTKRIGICILYLLLIFAAVLFFFFFFYGGKGILNQAIDTLGKRFPYLLPEYPVSIGEDSLQSVITLTCLWGVGILAVPGALLIQRGNRVFLSISLLFLLGAPAVLGIYPDLFWSAAAIFVLTAVWIRGHGEKLPFDRQLLAVTGTLGYLAVAAVLIFACMQLVFPVNGYEKNQAVKGILASFQKTVDQARYGGDEVPLPDGDFRKLGSFAPEGTPILEVTMSSPESYYLRGFTGGSYRRRGALEE